MKKIGVLANILIGIVLVIVNVNILTINVSASTANEEEATNEKEEKKDNELSSVTIKYNGKTIDIKNFLYGDGRTFVDLATFCETTEMCSSKLVNDTYEITKNMKLLNNVSNKYTYLVEHKPNTKIFTSSIIIGGRKIVDDENTQESTDVVSCPEDVKDFKCTDKEFYVPLRFLTQALGFRVEWDGETHTVNIVDSFEKEFFEKYDADIVEGECKDDISSCNVLSKNTNGEYELEKDKTYYMIVSEKKTKKIKSYSKYFSFYDSVKQEGDKEPYIYTKDNYQISSNELKVLSDVKNIELAGIIIYKITTEDEAEDNLGSYPFVVNYKFNTK